jgi:hypothetical protein
MSHTDRDATIKTIRANLKRRTGRAWSVTGGKGTAWGWIEIQATPKNRDAHGYTTEADRATLATALGLEPRDVTHHGISIPAGHDYRAEYLERSATGARTTAPEGVPYWD